MADVSTLLDSGQRVELKTLRDAIAAIPQAENLSAGQKQLLLNKARQMLVSSTKALSFSDIGEAVREAVYAASPDGQRRAAEGYTDRDWWYVEEIYPGYAILRTQAGHFKVGFTMSEGAGVGLAPRDQWKQVTQEWVEVS